MENHQKPSLPPKQAKAALMLVEGASKKSIAEAVGVVPHTISQWCKSPEFMEAVESHLHALETESLVRLRSCRLRSIESLESLIKSGTPSARLAAIRLVLENTPDRPRSESDRITDSMFEESMKMFETMK